MGTQHLHLSGGQENKKTKESSPISTNPSPCLASYGKSRATGVKGHVLAMELQDLSVTLRFPNADITNNFRLNILSYIIHVGEGKVIGS